MTEAQQKCIDQVMCWFDFQRVAQMMKATDFGWSASRSDFCEGVLREHVLQSIRETLERAKRHGGCMQSLCGGLRVEWAGVDTDSPFLRVEFIGESWDTGE